MNWEYLRGNHGRHGEVVGTGSVKTLLDLLWCGLAVVLDVSIFEIAVERLKVEEFRNIGVCRRAVVALVEIISQNLPVIFAFERISVVKIVVVEVVGFVAFLLVDVPEMFLPRHFWDFIRIHIDPDKAINVDLEVDSEKTVLLLVEVAQLLVFRSFGKFAIQSVRPAVVSTGEDLGISGTLFLNDRVCTVSTHVVECVDIALSVTSDDEVETCKLITNPVAGFLQPHAVGDEEPPLGEYSSALQLVHLW